MGLVSIRQRSSTFSHFSAILTPKNLLQAVNAGCNFHKQNLMQFRTFKFFLFPLYFSYKLGLSSNIYVVCSVALDLQTSFNLQVNVPGLEREITLGEMIELKLIDHTKTIVKSRRSNRYVSTRDALKEGDIDPLTGMYGNMNLLEARSK